MEDKVFCSDILDALTQDFFARKGNPIEEPAHVEEIKVNHPDPPDLDGLWWFLKGVDFTDLDELLFSWPSGDNVCGSAWIRANLVVVVETARRILCIAHTEGLEGPQPNYSHNSDGVIFLQDDLMLPQPLQSHICPEFYFRRCTKTEPRVPQWARWRFFLDFGNFDWTDVLQAEEPVTSDDESRLVELRRS